MANYSFSNRQCHRRQQGVFGDRLRESQDQADQFFKGGHRDMMCVFIGEVLIHVQVYASTVFLKKQCDI
jgi:hypothetical protein